MGSLIFAAAVLVILAVLLAALSGMAMEGGREGGGCGLFVAALLSGGIVVLIVVITTDLVKDVAKYSAITGKPLAVLVVDADGSSRWKMIDGWKDERLKITTKEAADGAGE